MNTTALRQSLRNRLGSLLATLHNGFAILGVGALLFLILQWGHWSLPSADAAVGHPTAFGPIRYDAALAGLSDEAETPQQRAVSNYLSRKYKVATDATEQLVGAAFEAGHQVGIDPLLILAVMAIESRLNPIAESVAGAKGLMQVIPRHHLDKFFDLGGENAVLDPTTNIQVGARILKEYIRRTGNLEAGLQLYTGALSDTSSQYAQKVIAEKERLRQEAQRVTRPSADKGRPEPLRPAA